MNVFELFGRLSIDGIEKVDSQLRSVEDKLNQTGKSMESAGRKMSMFVTAPLVLMGGAAIKTAADYSQSMAKVKAVTGATTEQFALLDAQAKELGRTTQFTASQVAEAMAFMGMAGMDTNKIMAALPDTLNLAAAGGLEMGQAADIITNIMAGFGMETEDLTGAVDVLAKAFTSSNVDLGMLGESMKYAGPIAKSFGLSFEETTAIMGSFGNAGIQGSMAGTSLRQALIQLNAKAEEFGLTMYDANGKILPMVEILEQLEQKGMTAGEMVDLFGARAGPAMAALLQTGSDSLRDFVSELEGAGGTADAIAKTQMEGLHGALITLKSAFEGLQLSIVDGLMPVLIPMIEKVTEAFRWFSNLSGPVRTAIAVTAGLAAAIGPLLIVLGMSAQGVGVLIGMYHRLTARILAHQVATVGATAATQGMTASVTGLNIAMSASKIGIIISAISLLVSGILILRRNWDEVMSVFDGGLSQSERKFKEWSRGIRDDASTMMATVESATEQLVAQARTSADAQIAAAEQVRDADKRSIAERLGYYQEFTADKLGEIDKQMIAELALIDGALGEQAQAYLDLLEGHESADEEREAKIEKRRIRNLKRQLESDEDLTREQRMRIEDQIADYEEEQEREAAADELFNAIKESDYEGYFQGKVDEADAAYNEEAALINKQRDEQIQAYRDQRDAFSELHEGNLKDYGELLAYAQAYSDIVSGIGGEPIEIPQGEWTTTTTPAEYLKRNSIEGMAGGGVIPEPTLLYGLRSQRPYAIAGENGPERVTPGEGTVTHLFENAHFIIREEADLQKIEDAVGRGMYKAQALRQRYA